MSPGDNSEIAEAIRDLLLEASDLLAADGQQERAAMARYLARIAVAVAWAPPSVTVGEAPCVDIVAAVQALGSATTIELVGATGAPWGAIVQTLTASRKVERRGSTWVWMGQGAQS